MGVMKGRHINAKSSFENKLKHENTIKNIYSLRCVWIEFWLKLT